MRGVARQRRLLLLGFEAVYAPFEYAGQMVELTHVGFHNDQARVDGIESSVVVEEGYEYRQGGNSDA